MNKKLLRFILIFIILQPILDVLIYFINEVIGISIPIISFIRPIIALIIYISLLFNYKIKPKTKILSFVYLAIYGVYSLLHLININDHFFALSYGSMGGELRYLFNYGYFLIQLINFTLIYKISNKEEKEKIIKSYVFAIVLMTLLYFIALLTKTSPVTYPYSILKEGWKGWSISSHYIGHSIIYSLPIAIYALFEKSIIKKWYKYLIFILLIIPPFYLVGTKAPIFITFGITVFYTFIKLIKGLIEKKFNKEIIYFVILSFILILTFNNTFGYRNFELQMDVLDSPSINNSSNVNKPNTNDSNINKEPAKEEIIPEFKSDFANRIDIVNGKMNQINITSFDNRDIQKKYNSYLRSESPIEDKLLGYGRETLPFGKWVETDFHTIYYSYGLIGFILIILLPLGVIAVKGIYCLINIKKMNSTKFLIGFGFGYSILILYLVGYTLQFSQTAFYLIILLAIATEIFNQEGNNKITRDYLFVINDLNIGGAEVGMVDVVNELTNQGKTVDIVLLRKRGPLLNSVDKNINIYEILNQKYNPIKQKLYHILYILGGPFIKYVYKQTIKCNYKTEIAYLEGYPSVFVSASSNPDSVKIASIRVGLKNHKLKASKYPWGEYLVKNSYKKMDHIYTVSELTTNEFNEKYPQFANKTTTIYTYFNISDIEKKSKEKYDFKFDKKKINFLAVGRFNAQKSYDRLVKAFKEIAQKNSNVLLHFIGNCNTKEGEEIKALIKELNLEDKVLIHGIINNPYPYIKDCDCLISSSLYEGFPRVVNEAISLKKLCIGTNVTGTKEALKNGDLGLLAEDSIEGLIKGMTEFIKNPDIYHKYAKELNKYDGNKKYFFAKLDELNYKRKKMIIYMPKLSYGGMEKALVNLLNYTDLSKKYDITLYLIYKGEMNYMDILPKNIKVKTACKGNWDNLGKITSALKLAIRYIYQIIYKYDIAISYSYQHPLLTNLTRLSSKNSILYIHSNLETKYEPKKLAQKLSKCKYEKFSKIICVSKDSQEVLSKLIKRTENIFALNNVIDGDRISELAEEKVTDFEFNPKKTYFVNISRHYEQDKRLTRIIEATNKLNKEGYDFEVIFIGDGEDHNLYKKKIRDLKLKNIHLLGKRQNPYKYLKHCNALILSSIREGYPVVFLEAMVLNKPIITTNVSDAKIDIENKCGIVVDNNDEAIYSGMKEYLDRGYTINNNFNYIEFNKEINEKTNEIYEED